MRKSWFYVLQEGKPTATDDIAEWSAFMENHEARIVAQTYIGSVQVSTVFLGLDHSHGGPTLILYETLVFGGECNGLMERYATREQAETGHNDMVKWIALTVSKTKSEYS